MIKILITLFLSSFLLQMDQMNKLRILDLFSVFLHIFAPFVREFFDLNEHLVEKYALISKNLKIRKKLQNNRNQTRSKKTLLDLVGIFDRF
jgi:hypothetical protein